jgi:hypothetical protein
MSELESKNELLKLHTGEALRILKQVMVLKTVYVLKNRTREVFQLILAIVMLALMLNSEFTQKVMAGFVENNKTFIPMSKIIYKGEKTHDAFLNDLAMFESSGRYNIVKVKGDYWGRYQIGPIARREIGIDKISQKEFLDNHRLQDGIVTALLIRNKTYLRNYIGEYEGKEIGNIYITQSGLLAGAHLRGHTAVIKFLESNGKIDEKDGNGVLVSKYINYFGNYNLNL